MTRRIYLLLMSAALSAVPTGRAGAAVMAEAWGYNAQGQLGNGTTTTTTTPVAVTGLSSGVTAVAGGGDHSLAVQNGAVYAWGYNYSGELGNGTTTNSTTPVAVTGLSSGVTAVAGGAVHSLAVRNGAVYAWGDNYYGELGNGTTTNSTTPVAVTGLSSGVTAVAGGVYHSLAVENGAVYAWGYNPYGQLGNGTTTSSTTPVAVTGLSSGVTAVAGGEYDSLAVRNGAVYAWGVNGDGQLGNGTTTNSTMPVAVTGLSSGVTAVAGGGFHSLALQNGAVYAWGYNGYGELGNGTTTNSTTPVAVTGITGTITTVTAAEFSSYALAADGSIWDWGDNVYGQLGLGTTAQYTTAQHLLAPAGYAYTSVSSNGYAVHALATLARPDAAVATAVAGTFLGTVTPVGSNGNYTFSSVSLPANTTSGSINIAGNLATDTGTERILLDLASPTQALALISDLNTLYGTGYAGLETQPLCLAQGYEVELDIPATSATPDYFNFGFTTVIGAGPIDPLNPTTNEVGSVAINAVGVVPEPASLTFAAVGTLALLRPRRRAVRD